jgi:peptidoglycan/LPS O-acetylase OafA/YrhL
MTVRDPVRQLGKGYIPSLDGIRALSFFLVFVAHAGWGNIVPGGFGVTVFFFLSGFLITTLLRAELEKTGSINLRAFYLRRALRILPNFYLVLVLSLFVTQLGLLSDELVTPAVMSEFLHFTNYRIIFNGYDGLIAGTPLYWSLAIEEHFYLVFPLLFLAISKLKWIGRSKAFLCMGICGLVLLWRVILVFGLESSMDRTYLATDTRIDSLLFGCALALWFNPTVDSYTPRARSITARFLLPAAVVALLFSLIIRDTQLRETVRYSIQGLSLAPIFVIAILYPGHLPFRILNISWLRFVGTISYSLYLVHHVVLYAVWENTTLGRAPAALLALAVSMALAVAIHLCIERPIQFLRNKLRTQNSASRSATINPATAT